MPTDRYRPPPEPDEDAYEDAWYRALKAKAARRFIDPRQRAEGSPQPSPRTSESGPDSSARKHS